MTSEIIQHTALWQVARKEPQTDLFIVSLMHFWAFRKCTVQGSSVCLCLYALLLNKKLSYCWQTARRV